MNRPSAQIHIPIPSVSVYIYILYIYVCLSYRVVGSIDSCGRKVVAGFFARTQAASDALDMEVAAVNKIQAVHRATRVRIIWHRIVNAAMPAWLLPHSWACRYIYTHRVYCVYSYDL